MSIIVMTLLDLALHKFVTKQAPGSQVSTYMDDWKASAKSLEAAKTACRRSGPEQNNSLEHVSHGKEKASGKEATCGPFGPRLGRASLLHIAEVECGINHQGPGP